MFHPFMSGTVSAPGSKPPFSLYVRGGHTHGGNIHKKGHTHEGDIQTHTLWDAEGHTRGGDIHMEDAFIWRDIHSKEHTLGGTERLGGGGEEWIILW